MAKVILITLGILFLCILLYRWVKRGIPPWWVLLSVEGDTMMMELEGVEIFGRPDAIYKVVGTRQARIIEEKSRKKPKSCYLSYKLQAAAYAILVEQNSSLRIKKVRIQFEDGGFTIRVNTRLKNTLRKTLRDIAKIMETGEVKRNHKNPAKCNNCQYLSVCDQALA